MRRAFVLTFLLLMRLQCGQQRRDQLLADRLGCLQKYRYKILKKRDQLRHYILNYRDNCLSQALNNWDQSLHSLADYRH